MRHNLKIEKVYANAIVDGIKTFEIRFNDRAYQTGDEIEFTVSDMAYKHDIDLKIFIITYVLPYYGLKEGYVALSIKLKDPQ